MTIRKGEGSPGSFDHSRVAPSAIKPAFQPDGQTSDRAREVLQELEQMFFSSGFSSLKMSEIADQLHCSRRMLYKLAPSKDELAVLVVDRVLQRLGTAGRQAASRQNSRIDELYTFIHTVAEGFQSASLEFSRDVAANPATRRIFDAHTAFSVALMESIVTSGVEEGEFRPVHSGFTAQMLSAGLAVVLDPGFLQVGQLTLSTALEELANLIAHGLGVEQRQTADLNAPRKGNKL